MKFTRALVAVALGAGLVASPAIGGLADTLPKAQAASFYEYFNGSANVGQRVNSSPGTIQGGAVYVLGWAQGPFYQRIETYYRTNSRMIYGRSEGRTGNAYTYLYHSPKIDSVSRCYFYDITGTYTSGMASGMKCSVYK